MQRHALLSNLVPGVLRLHLLLVFGLALALANRASADLIVNFGAGSVASGGTGYIDMFVESNGTDTFTLFNYRVEITPIAIVNGGILEFQESFNSSNPQRQLSTEQGLPNYVFAGKSSFDNFTAIRQDPDRLQLVGGDGEETLTPITISAGQTYLMARLELQHITPTPGISTGTYRVSLVQDPAQSYFQNLDLPDSDPGQPIINPLSYTLAYSGIVTVSAVPEPASMLLAVGVLAATALARRRRRVQPAVSGDRFASSKLTSRRFRLR